MLKDSKQGRSFSLFTRQLKKLDKFGEKRELTIGGQDSYRSVFGSLLTILIGSLLLAFIVDKYRTVVSRADFQIFEVLQKNNLDRERIFTQNETQFFFSVQVRNVLTNEPLVMEDYSDYV